ncbi:c-type cytochrome [Flavobacterium glaciei]|uniref:Cytochrome c n=1 Tax=Flavobacterium glaciei TaxID=386300 RepID=A0A562PXK5_9FLAO|nr:c-type cytochrome [Flavobacterium glaciei]RDI56558.1 cytochrome c [Flavobacterium glaciei]TWI49128.1 cytochrome c [Flavobacterium glaciei]
MKKIVVVGLVFLALSCKGKEEESFGKQEETTVSEGMVAEKQSPEKLGEAIFKGKGNCVACHQVDKKVIGPSLQDIAKIYKDKNADIVTFLKGEGEPIVDPSQYEVMKTNFAVTKAMSDDELKALEAYVYSNLK